jgi:hypothetical protein
MSVFNLIVLAITLLMVGFLLVWLCFPRLRPWFEAPKYHILTWEERYPEAARSAVDGERPTRSTTANEA